jgi:mannitol 2-dehydrogenase
MRDLVQLSTGNLALLDDAVRKPSYDRDRVIPAVCHIGVGGFHRAHQAVYLDDLLHLPGEENWGYCGIGLLEQDARMRDVMFRQECLYTVIECNDDSLKAQIVGSVVDYVFAPGSRSTVLDRLSSPECRIVSLTVTEGGYYANEATGEFNADHPDIVADLSHPNEPTCSFGVIVEALDRRRRSGLAPFTVMSCDNIQHNGDLAQRMMLAYAGIRDQGLESWIRDEVTFPNSMVDRIVPATTDAHCIAFHEKFGIDDAWPVVTEPFRQWVVEDNFCSGRPNWERVGVQITTDVSPYEKMKMRLLNGSHQALCYIGMLLGYKTVCEAIADPQIRQLVRTLMDNEVTPLLQEPAGMDLGCYKDSLLERFGNTAIADQLVRIGTDASARIPKFILPSISEQLDRQGPIACLSFVVASWFSFIVASSEDSKLTVIDPQRDRLIRVAGKAGSDPMPFLVLDDLFESRLANSNRFRLHLSAMFRNLVETGPRAALSHVLEHAVRY